MKTRTLIKWTRSIFIFCSLASVCHIQADAGEKTFGVRGGYVGRNQSGLAGLRLTYQFSDHFRLAPSANYIFRHHGRDAFMLAADGHFLFPLSAVSPVIFYPIAGISYWTWNVRNLPSGLRPEPDAQFNDVSTRHSRFALDCGAGLQWKVTPTMALSLEASYSVMHHTPSFVTSAGISYIF